MAINKRIKCNKNKLKMNMNKSNKILFNRFCRYNICHIDFSYNKNIQKFNPNQ
jgi:hypothetical protein